MEKFAKGTCFGVDCLGAFPMVRKSVLSSIGACDQFLLMIKSVIQAEEIYGQSLAKISTTMIETFPGTLQDCFSQLKADINHKSAQHFHFAENLSNEVQNPILELRMQLEFKEKEIAGQYLRMQQELKHLEENYRKRFLTFEKLYRDAFVAVGQSRKRDDISAEQINPETNSTRIFEETNTFISSLTTSLPPSISSFAGSGKGKEILQWVVSSTATASVSTSIAPVRRQDPQELLKLLSSKVSKAEKQRLLARRSWIEYVITSQRYSLRAQILITKLQALLESFIVLLQDHMRKMIVFESSSLANQQYDLNMLFKAMERIDVRGDLLEVIHVQRNSVMEDDTLWSSQIFFGGNLSHISALPRPPTNQQLTLELAEQPSYMSDDLASSISKMVLLQKKPQKVTIFADSLQGLGVYDGKTEEKAVKSEVETEGEQDEDEWYECAEDALSQLVDLQNSLRQHWLDVISDFNQEKNPSPSVELSEPQRGDLLGPASEGKTDCEEDNLIELDLEATPSPSSILNSPDTLKKTEDIMASWGLLDAVQPGSTPPIIPGAAPLSLLDEPLSEGPSDFLTTSNDMLRYQESSLL